MYDAIIENATASDSGTNNWRPTPTMKNDGTNTARMQNIESSRAMAVRLHASTTARARETPGDICVWMFSISTVASSTSTPTASASPPSVMMLMVCPVAHSIMTAREQRERDVHHHDQRAAPVAQEEQHHQTRSTAPSRPSVTRPRMELMTKGDWSNSRRTSTPSGTAFLKSGNRRLHGIDYGQRGSVGALGDRNVDSAFAVDVRVSGDDVGAAFDGADVAQINAGTGAGADGRAEQFGEIAAERGVGAGDSFQLAGPHIAGGHDQGRLADRRDGFIGRDPVLLQLVGIQVMTMVR